MKQVLSILFIFFLGFTKAQVNDTKVDWQSMTPEQQKEYIHKLSPEERRQLFRKFRENMLISELKIQENQKEKFISIYNDYATEQREIKNKFAPNKKMDQLSDEEAKSELEKSFEVAQQLLNSRKAFSKRFLDVLTPQQVIRMFHIEGKTRNEMMERKPMQMTTGSNPKK